MSIRQGFFSLYSLPSLGLFFSSSLCCVSLYCEPVIIHLGGGWGGGRVTGKRKMEGTCSGFSDLTFHFVKPYCYVSLVVQANLHTLVVLSFTEGFRTIFRLREKELEKNWADQQNWAMNLNHRCKETFWFLTMENQKTVCIFRFQNILPHQSNSPTKTWGRQRHEIFWRQRLCWLVKYVNANLPWSQFLTLVIQGFKTLVVKELFSQQNLFFSVFSDVFIGDAVVIA